MFQYDVTVGITRSEVIDFCWSFDDLFLMFLDFCWSFHEFLLMLADF